MFYFLLLYKILEFIFAYYSCLTFTAQSMVLVLSVNLVLLFTYPSFVNKEFYLNPQILFEHLTGFCLHVTQTEG